jgi:pimeloyl-ACP methyl ester carboxylesterase
VSPSSSYTAVGPADAPAIVLVHGTRLSRGMWHPQLAALSGGFRVVALDLPGHGALRDRPFAWDEAVEEIARVVDEAAGGRAVVCGLSLGGYLAIDVAARHPERVAGLVITGASAQPRGLAFPIGIRWLATLLERTSSPRLERVNRTWFRGRYPAATANAILAGGFGFRNGAAALRQLIGRDARASLAAYAGPTLILNGQLDVPFRLGQRGFRRAARDSRAVVLHRAGHLANLDRPSAYSAALARFTAEVARAERPSPEPAPEPRPAGPDPALGGV